MNKHRRDGKGRKLINQKTTWYWIIFAIILIAWYNFVGNANFVLSKQDEDEIILKRLAALGKKWRLNDARAPHLAIDLHKFITMELLHAHNPDVFPKDNYDYKDNMEEDDINPYFLYKQEQIVNKGFVSSYRKYHILNDCLKETWCYKYAKWYRQEPHNFFQLSTPIRAAELPKQTFMDIHQDNLDRVTERQYRYAKKRGLRQYYYNESMVRRVSLAEREFNSHQINPYINKCLKYKQRQDPFSYPNVKWVATCIRRRIVDIAAGSKPISDLNPLGYVMAVEKISKCIDDLIQRGVIIETQSTVLVGGSISPWVEILLLSKYNFQEIITVDYNQPKLLGEIDGHSFMSLPKLLEEGTKKFDLLVSYSSIEHDGLSRYWEPVNPYGSLASLDEYTKLAKYAIVGVPVINNKFSMTYYPNHRFFGKVTLRKMNNIARIINFVDLDVESKLNSFNQWLNNDNITSSEIITEDEYIGNERMLIFKRN